MRGLMLLSLCVGSIFAHDIITTNLLYTRDISRIFARRCVACHAAGSSIPLTTYEEVRPWAVDIKEQVLSRSMPQWGAVKGFGNLQPDHALTQEEIIIIAAWVIGGAPKGDGALLPKSVTRKAEISAATSSRQLVVKTPAVLGLDVLLTSVQALGSGVIQSDRVTAQFPDGRVEPLVWLYGYDPKWDRTFRLREPLLLPKGTRIEGTGAVELALGY